MSAELRTEECQRSQVTVAIAQENCSHSLLGLDRMVHAVEISSVLKVSQAPASQFVSLVWNSRAEFVLYRGQLIHSDGSGSRISFLRGRLAMSEDQEKENLDREDDERASLDQAKQEPVKKPYRRPVLFVIGKIGQIVSTN